MPSLCRVAFACSLNTRIHQPLSDVLVLRESPFLESRNMQKLIRKTARGSGILCQLYWSTVPLATVRGPSGTLRADTHCVILDNAYRADVRMLSIALSQCDHRAPLHATYLGSFNLFSAITSNPCSVLCLPLMLWHPFCRLCFISLYLHTRQVHVMLLGVLPGLWQLSLLALHTVPLLYPSRIPDTHNTAPRPLCVYGLPSIHAQQQRLSLLRCMRGVRHLLVHSDCSLPHNPPTHDHPCCTGQGICQEMPSVPSAADPYTHLQQCHLWHLGADACCRDIAHVCPEPSFLASPIAYSHLLGRAACSRNHTLYLPIDAYASILQIRESGCVQPPTAFQ